MATVTVRNVPEPVVEALKEAAARNGRSMESEIRQLLEQRYMTRAEALERIRNRPPDFPAATAREIRSWIKIGRK